MNVFVAGLPDNCYKRWPETAPLAVTKLPVTTAVIGS